MMIEISIIPGLNNINLAQNYSKDMEHKSFYLEK